MKFKLPTLFILAVLLSGCSEISACFDGVDKLTGLKKRIDALNSNLFVKQSEIQTLQQRVKQLRQSNSDLSEANRSLALQAKERLSKIHSMYE